jgi:hypothetical protein
MFKRINEPVKNKTHNNNANANSFNNVFIMFVFLIVNCLANILLFFNYKQLIKILTKL